TSPLKRAWQTAESISDTCGCTLATDKRLSEVDLGDLQGRSEPELDFSKLWVEGRLPYNVESFADVRERVKAAILDAVEQSDGIPAIIAHSGVFFALCHWLNRPHLFREIPHAKAVTITL
ncbi:MAG: histidine phosphatase family protein, partial [Pseudomonadota bacterium]